MINKLERTKMLNQRAQNAFNELEKKLNELDKIIFNNLMKINYFKQSFL